MTDSNFRTYFADTYALAFDENLGILVVRVQLQHSFEGPALVFEVVCFCCQPDLCPNHEFTRPGAMSEHEVGQESSQLVDHGGLNAASSGLQQRREPLATYLKNAQPVAQHYARTNGRAS